MNSAGGSPIAFIGARQSTEITKREQIGLKVAFWYSNMTAALRLPPKVQQTMSSFPVPNSAKIGVISIRLEKRDLHLKNSDKITKKSIKKKRTRVGLNRLLSNGYIFTKSPIYASAKDIEHHHLVRRPTPVRGAILSVSAHLLSRGSNRQYETLNLTTALPGWMWVSLELNIYPRRAEGEDHDLRDDLR